MKRMISILFLLPLLLLTPVTHGTRTLTATGPYLVTAVTHTLFATADGHFLILETFTIAISGDFTGKYVGTDMIIVNLSTGFASFEGSATFTGTLKNVGSGTLTSTFAGSTTSFPSFQATITVYSGTAGLAKVDGKGTIMGTLDVGGTYSILVTVG